jgi:transcriptional enhancer factor
VQAGDSFVRHCVRQPMQVRLSFALPGYEPLGPLPSASASVPVWQDRTIASSRLRLLEYSAFMEVQRDPDTVTRLGVGGALCSCGVSWVVQDSSSGS